MPGKTGGAIITYDRLTFDSVSGGANLLDLSTGVFTVGPGFAGVWSLSYGLMSGLTSGHWNEAWLFINGERIEESWHRSGYHYSEGTVESLGSRTLYMALEAGDTITLRTGNVGWGFYDITLCFQLVHHHHHLRS